MEFRTLPLPPMPVGATFCSGIGAPEVACPEIDWRFASEIEPFPRAVLERRLGYRLPDDHNQGEPLLWGDMAEIEPSTLTSRGVPLPDVLVAGTPCQAFSLGGSIHEKRRGTTDPRGLLTLQFVGICHAIQDEKTDGRLLVVWENVPGVLSDRENAFGCFLAGLVGGDEPLRTPDGKSWPRAGLVAGPRGRAAWLVRDAQHFGVAQRRRRVFVVASLGDGPDPAAILFEREGRGGDPAPRGGEVSQPAGRVSRGTGGDRVDLIPSTGHTAHCLNAGGMGRLDFETETMVAEFRAGVAPRVRKLTPTECHRLQGFPEDHCAIEWRGKPAPDGPQYKALGNSMAVPVMRWILGRALGLPVHLRPVTAENPWRV